jgi:hypothetical protein
MKCNIPCSDSEKINLYAQENRIDCIQNMLKDEYNIYSKLSDNCWQLGDAIGHAAYAKAANECLKAIELIDENPELQKTISKLKSKIKKFEENAKRLY